MKIKKRNKTGVRKKICSKCDKILDRNGRYCKKCHAKHMSNWRKVNPLTPEQRLKQIVRRKTKLRVQRGLLIPYPCEICNSKKVEAHHDDYRKPYCVRWLCRVHHLEFHKELRKKNGRKKY